VDRSKQAGLPILHGDLTAGILQKPRYVPAGMFAGRSTMRTLIATASAALLVMTGSAFAAGALSGMGANLFGNYFHFGSPNLSKPMVKSISAGGMRITLQRTKLADIRKAFGGTIQTQGDDKSIARWLCYQTDGKKGPATDTWFISNVLGGGEFVMIVAVQEAPAGGMPADCQPAPAKFTAPSMGIPGIGASSSDLKNAFGAVVGGSKVTYRADVPGADALGTANNAQYIAYILSGGRVVGYGAGETSVPNLKN
jgi:hypothetical protein